jgi:hypothetical protein
MYIWKILFKNSIKEQTNIFLFFIIGLGFHVNFVYIDRIWINMI